ASRAVRAVRRSRHRLVRIVCVWRSQLGPRRARSGRRAAGRASGRSLAGTREDPRVADPVVSDRTILCVFRTRPEGIQMAPGVRPWVCVTDQHVEMLDQVLAFFGVRPDERLGVMQAGQSPTQVAARVLDRLPAVLRAVRPYAVLVQGDTTTTVASALAAFYAGVPVGHVEAGLRPWRPRAPLSPGGGPPPPPPPPRCA